MKTINEPKKSFTQTAKNFFCQANEAEKFVKFRHQHLIDLAKQKDEFDCRKTRSICNALCTCDKFEEDY